MGRFFDKMITKSQCSVRFCIIVVQKPRVVLLLFCLFMQIASHKWHNAQIIFFVDSLTLKKELKMPNSSNLDVIKNERFTFSNSQNKVYSTLMKFLAVKLGTDVKGSPTNLKIKAIPQIHFCLQFKFKCLFAFWMQ